MQHYKNVLEEIGFMLLKHQDMYYHISESKVEYQAYYFSYTGSPDLEWTILKKNGENFENVFTGKIPGKKFALKLMKGLNEKNKI